MSKINTIPKGYHSITPSLVVSNAIEAIEFYKKAFDAQQIELIVDEGVTMHAEIKIGDSMLMLADANEQWNLRAPQQLGGSPVSMYLYVEDVDAQHRQAIDAGCKEMMPLSDMFWGDRFSQVQDPFGHIWSLATHIEDVSEEELNERMREFSG